jgi:hypothetical protein
MNLYRFIELMLYIAGGYVACLLNTVSSMGTSMVVILGVFAMVFAIVDQR